MRNLKLVLALIWLLTAASITIYSCVKDEKNSGLKPAVIHKNGSSSFSTVVYRGLINGSTAAELSVADNGMGTVTVNTTYAIPQPADGFVTVSPNLTLTLVGNSLNVSGGGMLKKWWVPFDPTIAPYAMTAGTLDCTGCSNNPGPIAGGCVASLSGTKVTCAGCSGYCDWKEVGSSGGNHGSFLAIEASTLIYNGITYN